MNEIDKSVFRIPGLEREKALDFVGSVAEAVAVPTVGAKVADVVVADTAAIDAVVAGAAAVDAAVTQPEKIAPRAIVVPKEDNFYEELTAISEEILECRSKILEIC